MKNINSQRRDDEFISVLRRIIENTPPADLYSDRNAVIEKALVASPSSFYVELPRALTVLGALRSTSIEALRRKAATEPVWAMWLEINSRVDLLLAAKPDLSFRTALNHVLTFQRPSRFFFSRRKALRLFRLTLCFPSRFRTAT